MMVVGFRVIEMSAVTGAVARGSSGPAVDSAVSCSVAAKVWATAACAFCAIKWTCWRPSVNAFNWAVCGVVVACTC